MIELSDGQRLALEQIAEISARSDGALETVGEPWAGTDRIWTGLSLATRHYRKGDGLPFRDRERLILAIPTDFPFKMPLLHFAHKRYAGTAHVQWGRHICLYQSSEVEWNPADGMFGLFERIDQWMTAAGSGELDPADAPLHPPASYPNADTFFVLRADAPPLPDNGMFWLGRAELKQVRQNRYDLIGWTHLDDWPQEADDNAFALAILFDRPLPMEYPKKVNDLLDATKEAGLPFSLLYSTWRLLAQTTPAGKPAHIVLGAPMRRKAAGEPLRQHLTVWEISPAQLDDLRSFTEQGDLEARSSLATWMAGADVLWCHILENRPEVINRRDGGALATYFSGRRVLVLGCGALGTAMAENIVRAGASALAVVDNGIVGAGLLVRQRYDDEDVGRPKALALEARLKRIGTDCVITSQVYDLASSALARFDLKDWDILIDATASRRVTHRIEIETITTPLQIPMVTPTVSAASNNGAVAVRMPSYLGGPHQLARQAKLAAHARDNAHPLTRAFWPEADSQKLFQAEPGCSAPTFVGSAFDLDAHASTLMNIALARLLELDDDQASFDMLMSPWSDPDFRGSRHLSYRFAANRQTLEARYKYRVIQSEGALKGIAAEIKRIARTRSSEVETGGLIFGEIDDSHRQIWIDSVSGPPPDSRASADQFLCGTAGTSRLAGLRSKASGGSSKFVGIWHTHPVSRGRPSEDDMAAMLTMLALQPKTPRHVIMLIIGFAATRPTFNYYLFRRDEFYGIATLVAEEGK